MMKPTIFAGASVAALLLATSAFAGPVSTILQNGSSNAATVQQDVGSGGGGEISVVYQAQANVAATLNTATVTQLGTGVLSVVQQDGSTNTGTATQTGSNLTSQIFQRGTTDTATITQVGHDSTNPNLAGSVSGAPTYNAAFASAENGTFGLGTAIATIDRTNYLGAGIIQSGDTDTGTITQQGIAGATDDAAHIVQSGKQDTSTITQSSSHDTAFTLQSNTGDISTVTQGGLGHQTAFVWQTGASAQSTITQNGLTDSALVQQTSDDHSTITQNGATGTANVYQTGSNDTSTITQSFLSIGAKAYVTQSAGNANSIVAQAGVNNTSTVGQGAVPVAFTAFH